MTAPIDAAERRKGYAITFTGVLILSPDALLLRLIGGEETDILGWRGGLAAVIIFLILCWRGFGESRASLRHALAPTALFAVLYAMSSCTFVIAIANAPASTVLVILATAPLMAGLMGWFVLHEKPARRAMVAIALGMAGGMIAGLGAALSGHGGESVMIGVMAALISTALLAAQFTLLRRWRAVDSITAVFLGSLLLGIVGFIIADPFSIPADRIPYAFILGAIVTPISFVLIMIGPRYLPGAEVSLMMLLETFLGPLWVWAVIGEEPVASALFGGALIVGAILLSVSQAFGARGDKGDHP